MKNKSKQTVYSQMQRFADVTKIALVEGNLERARHCMIIAEEIFKSGNEDVKNIVSNVYVFSVSVFMEINHYKIESLFTPALNAAYVDQINA
jgi:hypothetical protein